MPPKSQRGDNKAALAAATAAAAYAEEPGFYDPRDEILSVQDDLDSVPGDLESNLGDLDLSHNNDNTNNDDLPPRYSSSQAQTHRVEPSSSQTNLRVPTILALGVPQINLAAYCTPSSSISKDLTTITVLDPGLSNSPERLANFLRQQIQLPPKLEIRITGVHQSHGYPHPVTDFDIRINVINLFLPQDGHRGMSYISGVSNGRGPNSHPGDSGIETWAKVFCSDDSPSKSLTIYRSFKNWNMEYIEGCVRNIVAALKYMGVLTITFPSSHSQVVVSGFPAIRSLGSAIKSMFSETRKHEIHVAWPHATHPPGVSAERRCLLQNEETWWIEWRAILKRAILAGHVGWLGAEAWMELATSPSPKQQGLKPWGVSWPYA